MSTRSSQNSGQKLKLDSRYSFCALECADHCGMVEFSKFSIFWRRWSKNWFFGQKWTFFWFIAWVRPGLLVRGPEFPVRGPQIPVRHFCWTGKPGRRTGKPGPRTGKSGRINWTIFTKFRGFWGNNRVQKGAKISHKNAPEGFLWSVTVVYGSCRFLSHKRWPLPLINSSCWTVDW